MKVRPIPKKELCVDKFIFHLRLTSHSNDATEFILSEVSKFGSYIYIQPNMYSLEVSSGYDINEVAEYFESYNDKDDW